MFTREIVFEPAYDKRPKYGIHGVDMRWLLKGPKAVIQFVVFTNWQLPHVMSETDARVTDELVNWKFRFNPLTTLKCSYHPQPADLGYHARDPQYEGQEPREDCAYLDGAPCYYDGSSLNADDVFNLLVTQGGEAVWQRLEEEYRNRFGEETPRT